MLMLMVRTRLSKICQGISLNLIIKDLSRKRILERLLMTYHSVVMEEDFIRIFTDQTDYLSEMSMEEKNIPNLYRLAITTI